MTEVGGFGAGEGAWIWGEGTCRLLNHLECKGQGHPRKNGFILNVISVTIETLREIMGSWVLGHRGSSHLVQLPHPAEEQTKRIHQFVCVGWGEWVPEFSFHPCPTM